jgi:hypothetical protein
MMMMTQKLDDALSHGEVWRFHQILHQADLLGFQIPMELAHHSFTADTMNQVLEVVSPFAFTFEDTSS